MVEINSEMIDKIIDDNFHIEICDKFKKFYSITNYAVLCDGKLLCFTGSDIIDAVNISDELRKKYPDHKFTYSDEFMSFDD